MTQTALGKNRVSNIGSLVRTPDGFEEFKKVVLTSLQVLERDYSAIEKFCEV